MPHSRFGCIPFDAPTNSHFIVQATNRLADPLSVSQQTPWNHATELFPSNLYLENINVESAEGASKG